jgi:hypothetical protein
LLHRQLAAALPVRIAGIAEAAGISALLEPLLHQLAAALPVRIAGIAEVAGISAPRPRRRGAAV